jgi:DNA-binding NarL/FixJ family response regulator
LTRIAPSALTGTVATHLDRIYRKLGVSGRDELDAALENATGA